MATVTQTLDLRELATSDSVIQHSDASNAREAKRIRRITRLGTVLLAFAAFLVIRSLVGNPVQPGMPRIDWEDPKIMSGFLAFILIFAIAGPYLGSGRSQHIIYRKHDIDTTLDDVVGADTVKSEIIRSLNLFLAHKTFSDEMGGTARRGMLFAGSPGTGKTYMAKAMAGTADVPLVFVSATSFQSMFYGATARKIRSYFKTLRKLAIEEGGAIGFMEEFDAIGLSRSGMKEGRGEGASGVVNELLVQMQSFDQPTGSVRFTNWWIDRLNAFLPEHRQHKRRTSPKPNIMVIAATNRADDLDPALMRPGRFDRTITFDLPIRRERAAIASYYLARKSHDATVLPDEVARVTAGHSPVEIERILDEALVCALQKGRRHMSWDDVQQAQLIADTGLARDGEYTTGDRWRVAVHECGHAITALLLGHEVGVVSILKRGQALGITTHNAMEEIHMHTRNDLVTRVEIALGGLVAEELECGGMSSGASSDLAYATSTACTMIGALGMGDSLLSLDAVDGALSGNLVAKVLKDDTYRSQADAVLNDAKAHVVQLLGERRILLRRAAELLIQHDEIDGKQLAALLAS